MPAPDDLRELVVVYLTTQGGPAAAADAIREFVDQAYRQSGQRPSVHSTAAALGMSDDLVRRAMRYMETGTVPTTPTKPSAGPFPFYGDSHA